MDGKLTFTAWLSLQVARGDGIGELARYAIQAPHWPMGAGDKIGYYVVATPSRLEGALYDAFDAWDPMDPEALP